MADPDPDDLNQNAPLQEETYDYEELSAAIETDDPSRKQQIRDEQNHEMHEEEIR